MNSSPLYKQIAKRLKKEILEGNLASGDAIPSENKLAETYNVSRVTIRQAIDLLVSQELLEKVQGSGTYVKERKIEHDIFRLQGFTEEMATLKKITENKIIKYEMKIPSDSIQKILQIDEEEPTFFVSRLRYVDGVPLVLENTYLPVKLFPDLSYEIMQGSKYKFIEENKNWKIKQSFQEIIPIIPDEAVTNLLNLKEAIPILKVKLWSTLQTGEVFEYSELFFKSDEYKFKIVANR
ncbi:transcriptional regulator [Anaerobacillus alkalidiazotrophicus]|uniref:Transcriptional regulator n=1 Tax=Anaerobacillus alkalidiazotrophicus TaxID=472963 RepID=A0A1S2M0H1_9BACI|nr:UTRA domain-containing protein [Anaerobacillus alkalidiazotrophicus]OIJ18188.1 transcriptional regulator [Anaerobacillus alkalidiazotrophicus]OIJ19667.1 transcriptional regulator [Anaerobacillus alkalidiazotrophicus]